MVWRHPSPVSPSSCPMGAPALCARPSGPHLGTRGSECLLSKFPPAQMFCPAATSLGDTPACSKEPGRACVPRLQPPRVCPLHEPLLTA